MKIAKDNDADVIYGYMGSDKHGNYRYFAIEPIICKTDSELRSGVAQVMRQYHPAGSILTAYKDKAFIAEGYDDVFNQEFNVPDARSMIDRPDRNGNVECAYCLGIYSKEDCVHDRDYGFLCKDCLDELKADHNMHIDWPENFELEECTTAEFVNEEVEDDMSDEEFFEEFGKALKEKHDSKSELEEGILTEAFCDSYAKTYQVRALQKPSGAQDPKKMPEIAGKKRTGINGENGKGLKQAEQVADALSRDKETGAVLIEVTELKDIDASDVKLPYLLEV